MPHIPLNFQVLKVQSLRPITDQHGCGAGTSMITATELSVVEKVIFVLKVYNYAVK